MRYKKRKLKKKNFKRNEKMPAILSKILKNNFFEVLNKLLLHIKKNNKKAKIHNFFY